MDSMFEILMSLPLLKGVSAERMEKTVGSSKFHFLKYPAGATIFSVGDPCTDIAFVLSGTVELSLRCDDARLCVTQQIDARDVLMPEFLFGRKTTYPCSVTACGQVSMLQISKSDYINILMSDNIFLFNYLNLLSMNTQKSVEGVLSMARGGVVERLAYWVAALTQSRSHDVVLEATDGDLATLFATSHQELRAALDELRERGLIEYTARSLRVLDRQSLVALLG